METIRDLETLRKIMGYPGQYTPFKIHKRLNDTARNFIAESPFMMLATANSKGETTVSPKGDVPGFVHVEDAQTLYIPERKGNRLIFSLQNILDNPQVGLLFMVPGTNETLRVRGTAELTADSALCQKLSAYGKPALLVTVVNVTEAYFHCAKALIRSSVWQPSRWPERIRISFGEEIACNRDIDAATIQEFDTDVEEDYKRTV